MKQKSYIKEYWEGQEKGHKIGQALAKFLNLKEVDGRYNTIWGNKTANGLYESINRIINERGIK